MPHFSSSVGPSGALLDVFLAVSAPRRTALRAAERQIPPPLAARLLIDTGASHTCIDSRFVDGLNLQIRGSVPVHTPSTEGIAKVLPTYDVEILMRGLGGSGHAIPALPVVGCDFSGQNIDGLVGRDMLEQARLVYSGPDNTYMLSF